MADVANMIANPNTTEQDAMKEKANAKMHKHLSTIFVIVGIVSFSLGAIVNWYTIQRIKGGRV